MKILFYVLFFTTVSFSQKNTLGLNIAPNLAFLNLTGKYFNISIENNPDFNFSYGLQYQYRFNEQIAFVTEMNYFNQTLSYNTEFTDATGNPVGIGTVDFSYSYIHVPVLFRYYFGHQKLKVFANFGVSTLYLLSAKEISHPPMYGFKNEDISMDDYYSTFSFGGIGGLGVEYKLTHHFSVSFEARCRFQLSNQSNTSLITMKNNNLFGVIGVQYNY